jgi:hypothetical protein
MHSSACFVMVVELVYLEMNIIACFLFPQMAGQIDMNMQSDLMAAFEESL